MLNTSIERRNVFVRGHRTSLSLMPEMWSSLIEIARREEIAVDELVETIDEERGEGSLTAAVRVFCLAYWRDLSETLDRSK